MAINRKKYRIFKHMPVYLLRITEDYFVTLDPYVGAGTE